MLLEASRNSFVHLGGDLFGPAHRGEVPFEVWASGLPDLLVVLPDLSGRQPGLFHLLGLTPAPSRAAIPSSRRSSSCAGTSRSAHVKPPGLEAVVDPGFARERGDALGHGRDHVCELPDLPLSPPIHPQGDNVQEVVQVESSSTQGCRSKPADRFPRSRGRRPPQASYRTRRPPTCVGSPTTPRLLR